MPLHSLLTVLADNQAHHITELAHAAGRRPELLYALWQQTPPHIRGLLRQYDGQWRLVRPLAVFDEEQVRQIGAEHGFQTALKQRRRNRIMT